MPPPPFPSLDKEEWEEQGKDAKLSKNKFDPKRYICVCVYCIYVLIMGGRKAGWFWCVCMCVYMCVSRGQAITWWWESAPCNLSLFSSLINTYTHTHTHTHSGAFLFGGVVLAVAANVLVARRYGKRVMSWAVPKVYMCVYVCMYVINKKRGMTPWNELRHSHTYTHIHTHTK